MIADISHSVAEKNSLQQVLDNALFDLNQADEKISVGQPVGVDKAGSRRSKRGSQRRLGIGRRAVTVITTASKQAMNCWPS